MSITLKSPPDPPPPGPTPIPSLQVFLAGLTCCWPTAVAKGVVERELDMLAAIRDKAGLFAGAVGMTIDVGGAWPVAETWKVDLAAKITRIPALISAARARGIPIALYFWNTNDPGKAWRDSWNQNDNAGNLAFLIRQAKRLKADCGFEMMLVSAMNENDSSTSAQVREGLRAWFASNMTTDRLMSFAPKRHGERYTDTHPAHVDTPATCGPRHVLTSDNGPIITELYGKVLGTDVNVAQHNAWISRYGAGGKMCLYNLGQTPHIVNQKGAWLKVLKHYAIVRGV